MMLLSFLSAKDMWLLTLRQLTFMSPATVHSPKFMSTGEREKGSRSKPAVDLPGRCGGFHLQRERRFHRQWHPQDVQRSRER